MRLAISSLAWRPEEDRAIAALMRKYGVAGVELTPTKIWPCLSDATDRQLVDYRAFWNDQGIQVVALQAFLFGRDDLRLFDSREKRSECIEYFHTVFSIARLLGARVLVFGAPKNRRILGTDGETALQIACSFFRQLGSLAHEHGLSLCIEPLPPEYECNFITNSSEGLAFVKLVNRPGFGLHLDAAAMCLSKENIVKAIQDAASSIEHFHVSEPYLKHVREGGQLNLDLYLKALKSINYPHWISIEMREPDPGGSNLRQVEETMSFVSSYMHRYI